MSFELTVEEDYGIVQEHPSMDKAIVLRKAAWGRGQAKYEIRELNIAEDKNLKGVRLYNEEGLVNLAYMIIENGFCEPDKIKALLNGTPISELDDIDYNDTEELITPIKRGPIDESALYDYD